MAMLDVFLRIRKRWHLGLFVVHVNHLYRGDLAERDAKSVQAYCQANHVDFFRFDYDVEDLAKKWGMSFEEAGRKVRYESFERIRQQVGGQRIAVAQNRNDQAETILMRLMRGTGLDGLKGIPVRRGPYIIRPLLFMKRSEIEAYCKTHRVPVCHDHTNDQTIYTRNKIRHDLIPFIEENFNGQIVDGLHRLGDMVQTDVLFNEKMLDKWIEDHKINISEEDLPLVLLKDLDSALSTRLIRRIIQTKGDGLKNVSYIQIDEVLNLIASSRHGKKKIVSGLEFVVRYDCLHFSRRKATQKAKVHEVEAGIECSLVEMHMEAFKSYTLAPDEASIDLDKIDGQISVRFRRDGDKFQPMGMQGTKKLKKFFIDLKIPAEKRSIIPLVCDRRGIIWVVGHRLSERVKVDKSTCRVGIIKCSDSC